MADVEDAPDSIPVNEIDQHPAQVAAAEPTDAPDSIPVSEIDNHPSMASTAPASIPVSEIDQHPSDQPEQPEQPTTSAIGAFLRGAARDAAPAVGGIAAGSLTAGALRGAAEGAQLGKYAGPAGAFIGAALGGVAGGAAMSAGQKAVLDILGIGDISSGYNPFSTDYQAADEAQHPWAARAGGAADALLGMAVNPGAGIGQRLASAGLMGASDVGQQLVTKGNVDDPASVAMNIAAGAIAPTPRKPFAALDTVGGRIASRLMGVKEPLANVMPQEMPGTPGRPDIDADATAGQTDQTPKMEIANVDDVTPVAAGTASQNAPVKVGFETVGQPPGEGGMRDNEVKGPEDYGKKPLYVSGDDQGVTTGQTSPDLTWALKANQPGEGPVTAAPVKVGEPARPAIPETKSAAPEPVSQRALEEAAPQPAPTEQSPAPRGAAQPGDVTGTVTPKPVKVGLHEEAAETPKQEIPTEEPAVKVGVPKAMQPKPAKLTPEQQAALKMIDNSDHPDKAAAKDAFLAADPKVQQDLGKIALGPRVQNRPKIEGVPSAEGNGAPKEVTVRDQADLARKQGATNAAKSVYPDLQAIERGDPQTTRKLNDIFKKAIAANNGVDPIKGYRPNEKSQEYQLLNAAKKAIGGKKASINDFHDLNDRLKAGITPQMEQETKRINADIELNPRRGIDTEALAIPDERAHREDFEPALPDRDAQGNILPNQDRMNAQNKFQDWLANLSDRDYADATHGFDVRQEIESGSDPVELHKQMVTQLADAYLQRHGQRRGIKAPIGEPVPAEDVTGTPKPITSAADLRRVGPVENSWKPIDVSSPEGKEIAKAALEKANARVGKEGVNKRLAEAKTAFEDPTAARKTWKNLLGDETAAFKAPLLEWMQKKVDAFTNLWSPERDPYVKDYAKSLGGDFNVRANASVNTDMWIHHMAQSAPDLTAGEWKQMYRAGEDRAIDQLPQKLKDAYTNVIKPIIDKYNAAYDHIRTLDPSLNLPMRRAGIKDFMPRVRIGKTEVDNPDENDPIVGKRGLTNWSSALQDRDFYAIQDAAGNRMLLRADKFDGQVGDKITYKGKEWTVDHATAREIAAGTGNPITGFHENPLYNWLNAYRGVQNIRDNLLMLQRVQNDTRFLKASGVMSKEDAAKKGYIQTKMDQFQKRNGKDLYMDKRVAYALDDFAQAGFDDMTLRGLRGASTGLAKVLYTFGPIIHAFNEADLWAVGRGFDWLTPGGMRSLGVNGFKAIKSVSTQDDLQRQIRALGGNPMLAGSLTRGVMGQVAKKVGLEIAQNPSKFDPLARTFGISTPKLANAMYNQSTKGMWWLSDVLLTQRILENMDLHKMSMPDAIKEAHTFISDYKVGSTVLGSRNISKALQDPAVSLFGRYHMGLWNSYANIANKVLTGSGPERTRAVGQLLVAGAMAYAMYPLLDKGAQMVTGNKNAEFTRHGFSAIPHALSQIAQGRKDITSVTPSIFTPSMPINAGLEALKNRDYTGKQIVQQGDLRSVKRLGRAAVQEGEFAAKNLVSPYATISNAATQPRADAGSVAKKFATQTLGIKDPGQREIAYENKIVKENQQAAKQRFKKPAGMAEAVYNRIFGR